MRIGQYIKRGVAVLLLTAGAVWSGDWLVLRHKINSDGGAFDDVEVRYRFAVHLKNRQIEQRNEQGQQVECVNAMFPHYNESPCWYLKRHRNQTQDLDGGQWHFWSDDRP